MPFRDSSSDQHTPLTADLDRRAPEYERHSFLAQAQATALSELRAARRRPVRVAAAVVMAQMAGVCLANEAPGVMAYSWMEPLNIGLTLVLVQLAITGYALAWYSRYATETLDPLIEQHRASFPQQESDR